MSRLADAPLEARIRAVTKKDADRTPLILSYIVWPDDFPSPTAVDDLVLRSRYGRRRPLMKTSTA